MRAALAPRLGTVARVQLQRSRLEPGAPSDDPAAVADALAFLADGRRGYDLQVQGTGRVARGARLTRP